MTIYIKYLHDGEVFFEVFFEDQTGTSRSMVDIQLRAQELDGEIITEEEA
uniref:Uncharacterized protein n=1 Tax=viral metagenome TaxID=1070528 RepID=A0A6M3LHY5_9ZZZZ